jgi:hypothetical protein
MQLCCSVPHLNDWLLLFRLTCLSLQCFYRDYFWLSLTVPRPNGSGIGQDGCTVESLAPAWMPIKRWSTIRADAVLRSPVIYDLLTFVFTVLHAAHHSRPKLATNHRQAKKGDGELPRPHRSTSYSSLAKALGGRCIGGKVGAKAVKLSLDDTRKLLLRTVWRCILLSKVVLRRSS